jgi:two-component system CheB/CheR fusion protein
MVDFPSSFTSLATAMPPEPGIQKPELNLQTLADQLILKQFSPPSVLVNNKGDILYISGRTGKYLEPAAGKANLNIFAMAREGLQHELIRAFQRASKEKKTITLPNLKVGTNGGEQNLDLLVKYIDEPETLQGMYLVVFRDIPSPPSKKGRAHPCSEKSTEFTELEQDNKRLREELQNTREEMQTSQEELKATNEELQSTNEELQSTNEELTTSKEELQSLNEELQTVNAEMQSKVEELTRSNNDMKNLLNSTDIATMFLDKELNLLRFTTQMTRILKLKPRDVGRPITDIVSDLIYPEMVEDIVEVLQTLVYKEKQVATGDGRWYESRIMPYRTLDDKIDGVVITFTDITKLKKFESELHKAQK